MWNFANSFRQFPLRYLQQLTVLMPKNIAVSKTVKSVITQPGARLCSWCKNHHQHLSSKISPRTYLTSSVIENSTNLGLNQSLNSVRKNLGSLAVVKFPSRWFAGIATVNKIPLAKTIPLRRTGRKKPSVDLEESVHHRNVVAYAVGEEINISALRQEIARQGVYNIVDLPRDMTDVLMVTARYKVEGQAREAFFFSDGGVAFWHMSESERHELWKLARMFASNPYNHHLIMEESESLSVVYDSATRLVGDTIHLKQSLEGTSFDEECVLHKYTFSNALSQSVNLAISEASLEKFIQHMEPETQRLREGGKSRLKKKEINMKLGEVFQLRHEVNLESGYLDDPDIYWDREELEGLYRQMISYLSIPKRIKVLNERLNYCIEILQLLNSQLNDDHHVRLEWIIIILILIEVVFECIHYAEKYSFKAEAGAAGSRDWPAMDWYKGSNQTDQRNVSHNASK